jgi:putative peptide zinc metalloprotease protein
VSRDALYCARCGAPQAKGVHVPLDLVIGDTRVPLTRTVTVGRADDNDVTLADPTVSRRHVRVLVDGSDTTIEDAGSSHGTVVDGRPLKGRARLRDGSVVGLGDATIRVERHPDGPAAGRTQVLAAVGLTMSSQGDVRDHLAVSGAPRLRPGCALKQLEEEEDGRGWVLRDEDGSKYLRLGDREADLIRMLAEGSTIEDLLAASEEQQGAAGPARLARLLADLGEHGLLDDGAPEFDPFAEGGSTLARVLTPREREFRHADRVFQAMYRFGGWVLFSAPGLVLLGTVAVVGLAAFAHLFFNRHGTPFVVANKVGWGALAFILGRLAVVSFHEVGHGLTVASFGRRVRRAGVKLILIFPFAFVDTSDAWFEPRRRRMAVSAAGPATDVIAAGTAAIVATVASGTYADIAFQVALGAYVGALFNLNPLLDRDGYHILVDLLGQPNLRARSRKRLALRLAGRPQPPELSPVVDIYAVAALVWLLGCAVFAIVLSTRYYKIIVALTGQRTLVWVAFGLFYAMLFLPIAISVGRPLLMRRRI